MGMTQLLIRREEPTSLKARSSLHASAGKKLTNSALLDSYARHCYHFLHQTAGEAVENLTERHVHETFVFLPNCLSNSALVRSVF